MERQSILLVHSSMSPKVDNFAKPFKRAPTKLALKKYFRRSSVLHKNIMEKPRESVIVIGSSSSSSSSEGSDDEKEEDFSPIVIPDSDESLTESEAEVKNLPPETNVDKFEHVKQWVNNLDSGNLDETNFTELSSIRASGNFPRNKGVLNSTALDPASKKFDELFKIKDKAFEEIQEKSMDSSPKYVYNPSSDTSISHGGSPKNVEDVLIKDSLEEETEKNLENDEIYKNVLATPLKEPAEDTDSLCENFLDSLYGDSWRSNRHHILPQSEPQKKRIQIIQVKETKTEKKPKTVFKATPYLEGRTRVERKALQPKSPWREQLKHLCDSDTSDEDSPLAPLKLIFDTPFSIKENKDTSNLEIPKKKIKKKLAFELPRKALGFTDEYPLSFLASLANDVPLDQCDASARIFRSDYKRLKEELAKKLFKMFNENIFNGALSPETELEWNNLLRGTAGRCHCKRIIRRNGGVERYVRIVLSTKVLDCAERLRNTLAHEMCHAAAWVVNHVTDGHGPVWRSWTDKAIQVFPEIPPIRRCHDYEINTKYTYKCVNCGYSFGRHTKSLNTERKRCGYCCGKLEVFLNKITKKGEKKVVATPKKEATGWTLFVKENYGIFKTPDLKHGDVMKLLGQKFSSLKLGNAIE